MKLPNKWVTGTNIKCCSYIVCLHITLYYICPIKQFVSYSVNIIIIFKPKDIRINDIYIYYDAVLVKNNN